jgi:hypothetical protein
MKRMKRLAMLPVVGLSAIFFFLLAGCGGGGSPAGSQAEHNHAHQKSGSANLDLHPEGDSGVSGSVSFEEVSDGVLVKLKLRELPKPNTLYLAHIHPGTCAEGETHEHGGSHGGSHGEEESGHEHGGSGHEHSGSAEIEYPLSQVESDSEGGGSSTTTLHDTSVEKLFSGGARYVNVHAAGTGNPPILTCADLKEAR